MNKKELVGAVAQKLGVRTPEAAKVVNVVLGVIEETTASGEAVNIKNFGKFDLNHKPAREVRVPSTEERKEVEESWTPRWRPGAGFTGLAREAQQKK
ncbi:HU family DNA-binding protein [Streptosporangium sp. NPDC001681]|uniref:HU family DNA-binding protein n=1 Tax=Streptosporangium sp. NPDC001681 TaxID=3154395 RepID=UPI00331F715F